MSGRQRLKQWWSAKSGGGEWWLVVLVVGVYLVGLNVVQPEYFLNDDGATQFLAFYVYNWRSVVEEGVIPLFNWHQYLGEPYLSQGQVGVFYAPIYAAVWLSRALFGTLVRTTEILMMGHLMVMVVGMWGWMVYLKVRRWLGLMGVVMLVSFPFVTAVSRSWVIFSYFLAFVPISLLLMAIYLRKPGWKIWLGMVVVRALFISQGYVQWVVMTGVFEVIYGLMVVGERGKWRVGVMVREWRVGAGYVLAQVLVLQLTGPVWVAMAATMGEAALRSGRLPFVAFMSYFMGWGDFLLAQIGWFAEDTQVLLVRKYIYFVGVVNVAALMAVGVGMGAKAKWVGNELRRFFGLAVLALACSSILYAPAYLVPVLNWFRFPFKYFVCFLFFLTLTVVAGVEGAWKQLEGWQRRVVVVGLVTSVVMNGYVVWRFREPAYAFSSYGIESEPEVFIPDEVVESGLRVVSYRTAQVHSHKIYKYMTHNFATLYGVYGFAGYDSLIGRATEEAALALNYDGTLKLPMNRVVLDHLSKWGVGYVVTVDDERVKEELAEFEELEMIGTRAGVAWYRNSGATPVVYFEDAPEEEVEFEYGVNELVIRPEKSGVLVIAVPWNGRFVAFGQGVGGVLKEREGMMEIEVSGGGEVVMAFEEPGLKWGGWLLAAGLAELAVLGYVGKRYGWQLASGGGR